MTIDDSIYKVLDSEVHHDPNPELAAEYAMRIGGELAKATRPRSKDREVGKLWASDLGETCYRKTWYKFHHADKAEPLMGHTKFKFLYGNILEEAVLYMAEEAGHNVEEQQARVEHDTDTWRVSGRIDAMIDDKLFDVKTTSSFGYKKYKDAGGITAADDTFGYLYQLGFYHHFGDFGNKDAGFLWIDKQNGHIYEDVCTTHLPSKQDIEKRFDNIVRVVESKEEPIIPFSSKPDGKSGNMKLDIKCSYCDFKKHCHRDANGGKGLRTFIYNYGPVYLTDVSREPRVPEVT